MMTKTNNIFDSHSHYTDKAFDSDRDALISGLPEKGVAGIVTVGTSLADSEECVRLAERYPHVYAACGIHPECESDTPDGFASELERILTSSPKVRALGEIGLDYHYENYNRERQIQIFTEQLQLAEKLGLPAIIHSRNATEDTMEILRKYRPKGVLHCFSGSAETAKEVISLGLFISFTGAITFKNAKKALKALAEVPLERLMLETDCPYMAPEPFRGRRCDSSLIAYTAQKAAEIKGVTAEEMLQATCRNACEFFGI